ncbi:MAG: hypothetical protein IJH87_00425, partial [Atopobiaceae bacterium]|nr:hypothetical protein [Atopobiaceae bacterium]
TKIFMQLLTRVACKLFRTELIHARDDEAEPTCFPETYLYGEDTAFTLLYMRDAYTMRTVDGIGYYYCRRKGNSLSYNNTVTMRKILDLIRLWENAFGGRWTKEIREIYNQEVCVLLSAYLIRISRMDLPYDQQKTLFFNAIRQTGMERVMKETRPYDKKTLLLFTSIRLRSYRLFWIAARFLPSNVRFVTDTSNVEGDGFDL